MVHATLSLHATPKLPATAAVTAHRPAQQESGVRYRPAGGQVEVRVTLAQGAWIEAQAAD